MRKILTQLLTMAFLLSVSLSAQSLTVTSGTPLLDGVVSPGEWTSTPLSTGAGVTLNAMADGQYLYLSASWSDETESIQKKEWAYDGSAWSQSGNEDRFAFIWDMGMNGSDGANCATMCHDGMATNSGTVDVWHWKAARGNALGFTDDKHFNNVLGDDGGRHGDPGTSAYSDNADDGSGFPSFMASGDPGANTSFLAKDAATLAAFDPYDIISPHTYSEAVAFDNSVSFSSGAVIPGYVLRNPAGDRASVQSAGKYEDGVWTVEFRRSYSGSEFDFEVVPGSSVEFTHEIFDNTGGGHPDDGFDATLYTLDFSNIVTDVDNQLTKLTPTVFELNQNYPNPFNPSTIISFSLPKAGLTTLKIYDVLGREVFTLLDEWKNAGVYTYGFNGRVLSSGIYIYSLQSGDFLMTKKMVLIK
jgi:Ethylbenzene dehydrogenase/Secretion system C-terminal sorting domain